MKKIIYIMTGAALMSLTSCIGIDNYDGPDAQLKGRMIDELTGENIMTSDGELSIYYWETSYKNFSYNNSRQEQRVKQDGTYQNTKFFSGTYDFLPKASGAYWSCDTVKGIKVSSKSADLDFTVTPYLVIEDFQYRLEAGGITGTQLLMSCKIRAPKFTDGKGHSLPNLKMVRPFVNSSVWCGATNCINDSRYNDQVRINIDKSWDDEMSSRFGLPAGTNLSGTYQMGGIPVQKGMTYWIRMGANVNENDMDFNYSPIVEVKVE